MNGSSPRRPVARSEKWLIFGAPAVLAVLLGGAAVQSKINANPVVVFPTPVPEPQPNGYDFYLAANRAIAFAKPPVDTADDTRNLPRADPQMAIDYSVARKTAWLKSNAAGFALFRQGMATPTRHPNTRGDFLTSSRRTNYSQLRLLMRKKLIEAHTFALQKRWNDAVQSSLDNMQMGNDMARGGPLLGKLVSSAIIALGRSPLMSNDFLPEKLDVAQARAATKRLETILGRRWSYKDALEEDRWNTLSQFLSYSQTPKWRSQAMGRNLTWRDKIQAYTVSKGTIVAQINRSFDLSIADLGAPWSAPRRVQPRSSSIATLFTASSRSKMTEARELVPLHVLLLRFALRAYHLENGAFPTDLKALAPKYLQKIPTDLYADGAPFHYRLKKGDYELWSVGPDGKDNSATPIGWRDGKIGPLNGYFPPMLPNSNGDYVARQNN